MKSAERKKEMRCRVTGKVQGVFYRNFVAAKACEQDIKGSVKNCSDGSVHVVAQGDYGILAGFLEILRKGSASAEVAEITVEWSDPTQTFQEFSIQ